MQYLLDEALATMPCRKRPREKRGMREALEVPLHSDASDDEFDLEMVCLELKRTFLYVRPAVTNRCVIRLTRSHTVRKVDISPRTSVVTSQLRSGVHQIPASSATRPRSAEFVLRHTWANHCKGHTVSC